MNKDNSFVDTIVNIFSKRFYFLAALASILAFVLVFVKDEDSVRIALYYILFAITIFTSYLVYSIYKIFENIPGDYKNVATFVKYSTENGNDILFETYKIIQVKKPLITEFIYNFKWTGSTMPKISSDLQEVKDVVDVKDESKYDKAILTLKNPAYYNQNIVLHFKAALDDTDKISKPHVEMRVTSGVSIIHYRIILLNKPDGFSKNAILERKKINSDVNISFTKVKEIPFDQLNKCYEYHLLNPKINHYYRIRWEK